MTDEKQDRPASTDGLVERLRRTTRNVPASVTSGEMLVNPDGPEAADALTMLSAENARLREALELTMVGGNHLANVLIGKIGAGFAEKFPPDMEQEDALRILCATDTYEVWCCWTAIMRARSALEAGR